jgi:membrane protein
MLKNAAGMVKEAGVRWVDDGCYRLGASLAYYALFSLFPLLLVAITVLGFFLGSDPATRENLLASVSSATSPEFRDLLDQTLQAMQEHQTARGVSAVIGVVMLFSAASGVFSELQFALNRIWRVKSDSTEGIGKTILIAVRDKAIAFAIVAGAAVFLLLSLMVTTALHAADGSSSGMVHDPALWLSVEVIVSLALASCLFAVIFRMLPQTHVAWRDVAGGAILTAVIFSALKHALGWYLGHIGSYAAYGAVGAVLGLMTWIYVASLVIFYGAEVTRVYAERAGSRQGEVRTEAKNAS